MGSEVIPMIREYPKELGLPGPFEVDPVSGQNLPVEAVAG